MSKHPSLLEQFRSFYLQNNPKNMEDAIKYFSVFGGIGWRIDTDKPLEELIESKIYKNYTYIHNDITKITDSDKIKHALLSGVATGDSRSHSAFKRARISRADGENALDLLCDSGIVELEHSLEEALDDDSFASHRVNFMAPFVRFWFSSVSPFFQGIKEGDYKEASQSFLNREYNFYEHIFQKLSLELVKKEFSDDPIVEIGSYWDKNVTIDILAKTRSGKTVAGICKYAKVKAKKSELTKLKEQCLLAKLTPDICIVVSKSGFSNELKSLKSDETRLYALKSFRTLVENLSQEDIVTTMFTKKLAIL